MHQSLCPLALTQPPEKLPRCDALIRGWVRVRTLVHGMHDLGMARSELCRGIWQSPLFQAKGTGGKGEVTHLEASRHSCDGEIHIFHQGTVPLIRGIEGGHLPHLLKARPRDPVGASEDVVAARVATPFRLAEKWQVKGRAAADSSQPAGLLGNSPAMHLPVAGPVVINFVDAEQTDIAMCRHIIEALAQHPWFDQECVLIESQDQFARGTVEHMAKRDTERVDEALDSQGPFIPEDGPVRPPRRHQSFVGSVARVVIDDNDLVWLGTVRVHTLQSVECRFYAGPDGNNNCGTRSRGGYGWIGHESASQVDREAGGLRTPRPRWFKTRV